MLKPGDEFPDWAGWASIGGMRDAVQRDVRSTQWKLYWFFPKAFTPVCATELEALEKAIPELTILDIVILAGCGDNEYALMAWQKAEKAARVSFPLCAWAALADEIGIDGIDGHPERASFLVDETNTVRWAVCYDRPVGRSVKEAVRVARALRSGGNCGCDWEDGDPYVDVSVDTAPPWG